MKKIALGKHYIGLPICFIEGKEHFDSFVSAYQFYGFVVLLQSHPMADQQAEIQSAVLNHSYNVITAFVASTWTTMKLQALMMTK